jgi:hypothetical protein
MLSPATRAYFEKKYGVTLKDAAGNPDITAKLRAIHQPAPDAPAEAVHSHSTSATQADAETLRMLRKW